MAKKPAPHRYSVERLSHFRCGACDKWWTVADAPSDKVDWHCPWCGAKRNKEKLPPFKGFKKKDK